MPQLKVGAAQSDITPPVGTGMAGYVRRQAASQAPAATSQPVIQRISHLVRIQRRNCPFVRATDKFCQSYFFLQNSQIKLGCR